MSAVNSKSARPIFAACEARHTSGKASGNAKYAMNSTLMDHAG